MSQQQTDRLTKLRTVFSPRVTVGAFVVLFTAVHYVIYLLFPFSGDDMWYAEAFIDYATGVKTGLPLREMAGTVAYHFTNDNVRLANILLLPLLLLPKWLSALVPSGAVGAMLLGVGRLGSASRYPSALMLTAAAVLLSFTLPWHENFFSLCFAMNYIVPASMAAWFLVALLRAPSCLPGRRGWVAPVTAVLVGAFNEAFSLPLMAVVILLPVCFRRYRIRRVGRLALCLAIGTLYVVGTRMLIVSEHVMDNEVHTDMASVIKIAKLQVPLLLYVAALVIRAMRRGLRSIVTPVHTALLTVALLSVGMNIIFQHGERISTFAHMASVCGLLRVCSAVQVRPLWRGVLTASGLLLLVAHYAAVIRLSAAIHRQWTHINSQILSDGGPETHYIFTPLTLPEMESLLAWRKPSGLLVEGWNMDVVNRIAVSKGYSGLDVSIVPQELAYVTPFSGEAVPGGSGIRRIGHWYFRPYSEPTYLMYRTKMGPFTKAMHYTLHRFTSQADGSEYLFMVPQMAYFPSFLLPIDSIHEPVNPEAYEMPDETPEFIKMAIRLPHIADFV